MPKAVTFKKHKLCLSDEETVAQIQENPYLQYFVGLPGYQMEPPFAASLLVEIRKRVGQAVFDDFQQAIIDAVVMEKQQPASIRKVSSDDDDSGHGDANSISQQDFFEQAPASESEPEKSAVIRVN